MEQISAFMDGESGHAETHQAVLRLKQSDECCETWATFHLIGDMMRGDPVLREDFMVRFNTVMSGEPTQLAPRFIRRKTMRTVYSIAASLSAVAVASAIFFTITVTQQQPQSQVAQAPKTGEAIIARQEEPARLMPAANRGKVNEYLMAHQEFSPSSSFQGLAPYVRTVSESRENDGR